MSSEDTFFTGIIIIIIIIMGARGGVMVKTLRYKPAVESSIPDVIIGIFQWHNPSGRTMALGSIQSLTEMSTRNIFWGVKAADA